ncbi:Mor transcription activator family protein [Limnobaculum xujianqingii]|uniref:Mor transcription activator family protein n=1 Tax=Limnobaculum xujianqingii TaxID=2738837 RepID=UPI0011268DAB|nr:Mor transcription activator family protein [Limnobaculum xujianqingii]
MNLEELKDFLPGNIQEAAEIIGYPATLKLVEKLGGITFPFSKGVGAFGKTRIALLVQAIGKDHADKLMSHFGGEDFYIPRCAEALREHRNRQFLSAFDDMKNAGESASMSLTILCPQFGFSDRFAWELLSKYNRTDANKQDTLF